MLAVKFLDVGLPPRAVFLKADHIGSIPGRDGSKPRCSFSDGVAIVIIAEPDVETDDTEIHNQTAFRTLYGDYRVERFDLQYVSIDDLTDEEIALVIDSFSDELLASMMGKLLLTQSVPEILGVLKTDRAHEDYNPSVRENHDQIDFIRENCDAESAVFVMKYE